MLKKDYAKQSEGQKIGKKLNAEWWASKSGGGRGLQAKDTKQKWDYFTY